MVEKAHSNSSKDLRSSERKKTHSSGDGFERSLRKSEKEKNRKEDAAAAVSSSDQRKSTSRLRSSQSDQYKERRGSQKISTVNGQKSGKEINQGQSSEVSSSQKSINEFEMTQKLSAELQPRGVITTGKGSIDISGMSMVSPEAIAASTNKGSISLDSNGDMLDSSLSSIGGDISKLNSLLENATKDSSGGQESFNGESVLGEALGPMQAKVKGAQNFNEVLNTKLDGNIESLKQENVDNIVHHAKAFIKDGGGEMKLQLKPEGLGTIDLKVDVRNGQVSVEILTDSKSTKTIFENGVSEMRGALESQNLMVDMLKVDISDSLQKEHSEGQLEMMDRDFAKGFLNNFKDDRNAFKQQFAVDEFQRVPGGDIMQPEGLSPVRNSGENKIQGQRRLNIFA